MRCTAHVADDACAFADEAVESASERRQVHPVCKKALHYVSAVAAPVDQLTRKAPLCIFFAALDNRLVDGRGVRVWEQAGAARRSTRTSLLREARALRTALIARAFDK